METKREGKSSLEEEIEKEVEQVREDYEKKHGKYPEEDGKSIGINK